MTRSGYTDDYDGDGRLNLYRRAVERALFGKRGQAFLREMLKALDALPEPILIKEALIDDEGDVCAMGAVARSRGADVSAVDPDDAYNVAKAMGIAESMAREIAYVNDNDFAMASGETPQERFQRVRAWIVANIEPTPTEIEERALKVQE